MEVVADSQKPMLESRLCGRRVALHEAQQHARSLVMELPVLQLCPFRTKAGTALDAELAGHGAQLFVRHLAHGDHTHSAPNRPPQRMQQRGMVFVNVDQSRGFTCTHGARAIDTSGAGL